MTTLTVNFDDKKSELSYNINPDQGLTQRPLNKAEPHVYTNMKRSLEQIKLHQDGKIELRDTRELLNEL